MTHNERDLSVLKHIIQYCNEIETTVTKHELTLEKIKSDVLYKNALSMEILQIGELVNTLSDEFKSEHHTMPWREIKRMRDMAAHHYIQFETTKLWETVAEDIAPLKKYCKEQSGYDLGTNYERIVAAAEKLFNPGCEYKSGEIKDRIHAETGINIGSIMPQDHCWNSINGQEMDFTKPRWINSRIFEKTDEKGVYRYVGNDIKYTGVVYRKGFPDGQWRDGIYYKNSDDI